MRSTFIITLSILLSISILGPSFLVLINSHCEIKVALDLGEEENKEESKKELEEKKDTVLYRYHIPTIKKKNVLTNNSDVYIPSYRGYVMEVKSPPPEQIV